MADTFRLIPGSVDLGPPGTDSEVAATTLVQRVIAVAAVIGCIACGGPGVGERLPEIPTVVVMDFPEAVRGEAGKRIQAVTDRPEDPWSNGDLASILHAHGRVEPAAILYERAESLSGGEFRWTYLRGVALQQAGRSAEAVLCFQRALETRHHTLAKIRLAELLAEEDLEGALAILNGVTEPGGNEAAASYALGRVLVDLDRALQAIPILERALELAPESGAVRYVLAMAQRSSGDEDEADRHLDMLAGRSRLKPALKDPLLERVEALAHDEHHFLNLGKSQEAAGKLYEAIRSYESALELDPGMASAHANLVGAYGQAGDFEHAQKHYERAMSIDAGIEELHNNWGVLMASREDPVGAEAAFRRALAVNPRSAKAHANLGVALVSLERGNEAIAHFRQAVANDPQNRPARMNLGFRALNQGQIDEAVANLEAALKGPEDGSGAYIRYMLGRAYKLSGRTSEAREQLDAALRLAEAERTDALANQIRTELASFGAP